MQVTSVKQLFELSQYSYSCDFRMLVNIFPLILKYQRHLRVCDAFQKERKLLYGDTYRLV